MSTVYSITGTDQPKLRKASDPVIKYNREVVV
jgi:hypothetical protein